MFDALLPWPFFGPSSGDSRYYSMLFTPAGIFLELQCDSPQKALLSLREQAYLPQQRLDGELSASRQVGHEHDG